MPKQEFQVTQGLLEDDMRRQAGSIEKSWLEAVMNSVDAGASSFNIYIESGTTVIEDDGSGMSEDGIELYFKQFGFKDDDTEEKTFGKFRRGRGQIFNFGRVVWETQDNILVVDLDNDESRVPKDELPLDFDASDSDVWVDGDDYVFNTEGLGFNQQPSTHFIDGTEITVNHYSELENATDKANEFKKLAKYIPWLHDIEIYINNEQLENDFNPSFETEYAYYAFMSNTMTTSASVYNLGAFVDTEYVKDNNGTTVPVNAVIITKDELELNNARTDIIDGCSTWKQVKEDLVVGVRYFLAEEEELGNKQKKWLISQASEDDELYDMVKDRELIDDVQGNSLSITDLQNEDFAFAPSGNAVAQDVMDRKGITMVDDSFGESVRALSSSESNSVPEGREYQDVMDSELQHEMKEWDESGLSKRRKENLQKIRWFLREVGCYDDVKPGHSNHENVWRTDKDTILVDKDFLNANKNKFVTHVIDKVVEIAAFKGDTRGGWSKDVGYNRKYQRYMSKSSQPRQDLMTGNYTLDRLALK